MDKIYKAKEKYNSTPVPPELEVVVNKAIEQASGRKVKKLPIPKALAPVAVCAVICLAVGIAGNMKEASMPQPMPRLAEAPAGGTEAYVGEPLAASETAKTTKNTAGEKKEIPAGVLPFGEPLEMYFSSGVGAWGTKLTLKNDGTFVGYYSDSEMGDMGDEYPKGTVYECKFSGSFSEIEKIDDFTYSMKLSKLDIENKGNVNRIENGIRYVESEPYGVCGGEEFLFYLPGKSVSALTENQRFFWHGDYYWYDSVVPDTISCYALINTAEDMGLFTVFEELVVLAYED